MLSSNISNSNGNEITDWVHFHAFLQKSLEDVVIPVLLELLHDKEKTLYIDSLRIVIDSLICLGSNEVIRKVQVIIDCSFTSHVISIEYSHETFAL